METIDETQARVAKAPCPARAYPRPRFSGGLINEARQLALHAADNAAAHGVGIHGPGVDGEADGARLVRAFDPFTALTEFERGWLAERPRVAATVALFVWEPQEKPKPPAAGGFGGRARGSRPRQRTHKRGRR